MYPFSRCLGINKDSTRCKRREVYSENRFKNGLMCNCGNYCWDHCPNNCNTLNYENNSCENDNSDSYKEDSFLEKDDGNSDDSFLDDNYESSIEEIIEEPTKSKKVIVKITAELNIRAPKRSKK